jgi:hypothetical protein
MLSTIVEEAGPLSSMVSTAPLLEYLGHRAKSLVTKSPFWVHFPRHICSVSIFRGSHRYYYTKYSHLAAAIDYLDSGKVKVAGIVNKTFKLEDWGKCLAAMKDKSAIKAAIVFD